MASTRVFRRSSWQLWLVWYLVGLWTITIGRLVMRRHNNFGTFDYDLGIHDQAIWLLGQGQSFNTVRGMASLGHHATFAFYLLVPLQWLGGGPNLWNILQCFAIAVCAIPIFLIARNRFRSEWIALALACGWLLQPWLSWFAQETFHPEVMAMPFLFLAFLFLDPRRFDDSTHSLSLQDRWGIVALVLAMSWKEDVALVVAMLGLVMWIQGRGWLGRRIFALGLSWFVVFGAIMVPRLAGGRATYGGLYGSLGESSFQVLVNSILNPSIFMQRLIDNQAHMYAWELLVPFALIALLSPWMLCILLPQFFANILSLANFTYEPHFHYQALPMVVLMLATIDGLYRLLHSRHRSLTRLVVPLVVVFACTAGVSAREWGILPYADQYRKGAWPLAPSDPSGWTKAVERVGPSDGVAAHYLAVSHLTHREVVYTFPNPWLNSYYGIAPEDLGDASKVNWIIVMKGALNESAQKVLDGLLSSGEFGDEQSLNGIASYRRLLPSDK